MGAMLRVSQAETWGAGEMPRRELCERSRIAFDPAKEIAIADQRDLDRLRHARAVFACRQVVDKGTVINNGPWRREGANQILQSAKKGQTDQA